MINQEIFKVENKETRTQTLICDIIQYGTHREQVAGKRLDELLTLIDGAYDIIEIYDASSSPYNTEWRKQWLKAARECGAQPTW